MSDTYIFESPLRMTFGTIGRPGQRTFLFQVEEPGTSVTVKLEKIQVNALSMYLGEMLKDLPRPGHLPDDMDLNEPMLPEWPVRAIATFYDEELDRVFIVMDERAPEEESLEEIFSDNPDYFQEGESAKSIRVIATREQVSALAIRGKMLVEAGRPPCPLCGYPLDPKGHDCPRTNGYRPPLT